MVMLLLLLQSAGHHRSRMRLYYSAHNPAKDAPCCADGRGGWVRVEAEPQWQRGRCPGSRPLLDGRPALSNLNTLNGSLTQNVGTNKKPGPVTPGHTLKTWLAINGDPKYAHEPAAARRSERLAAALAPPWVSARLCPLRRSLLAFGSNPASRATRTPNPSPRLNDDQDSA